MFVDAMVAAKRPSRKSIRADNSKQPSKQTCLLVLGMHRSGTSALTRVLNLAGATLPRRLLGAGKGNDVGHWEPEALISYHDRLLASIGSAWHDWQGPDFSRLAPGQSAIVQKEILAILKEDFGKSPLFVLKEPRMCRFAPLIIETLNSAGINVVPILANRNPLEIVESLMARSDIWPDDYTGFDAYMLWLRHVLDAERATRGMKRAFVSYEALLADWQKSIKGIEAQTDLILPKRPETIAPLVDNFLTPSLRHHSHKLEEVILKPELRGLINDTLMAYKLLETSPSDAAAISELDIVYESLLRTLAAFVQLVNTGRENRAEQEKEKRATYEQAVLLEENLSGLKQTQIETRSIVTAVKAERDAIKAERDAIKAERDAISAEVEVLTHRLRDTQSEALAVRSGLGLRKQDNKDVAEVARAQRDALAEAEAKIALLHQEQKQFKADAKVARENLKQQFSQMSDQLMLQTAQADSRAKEMAKIHRSLMWWLSTPLRQIDETRRREREDCALLRNSPLFDAKWYLEQNPDVKESATDPALHYLRHGAFEGRQPSEFFDGIFYLREYPDILRGGLNPLVHYLRFGERERRSAKPDPSIINAPIISDQLVSIIVPNYNHAKYLERRLATIYNQDHQTFEVILLDDCSDDHSQEILEKYANKYPDKTRFVPNTVNSGGGYKQWSKGLSLAKGELVWIAESDDWSDPSFLSRLLPSFKDEAVSIAYTNSSFVDEKGDKEIWSTDAYLNDINPTLWKGEFILTGHQLMERGCASKNIIPNVSGSVFRHPGNASSLLEQEWCDMKICGDWLFYLNLMKGGRVAYIRQKLNFYRVHDASTARATFSKDVYYKEHASIARYICEYYDVSQSFLEQLDHNLRIHWKNNRDDYSQENLRRLYDPALIKNSVSKRLPNILMCGYAFAVGGGETLPIFLSNMLRERGYSVTFLSCEQEPCEPGVRKMLRPDIPVVYDWRNLANIVDEFGIDFVHSHHAWADGTVRDLIDKKSRAQLVVTMHGMYESLSPKEQSRIIPKLLNRCAKIAYVANKNKAPFEKYKHADKLVHIKNGLANYTIQPLDRDDFNVDQDSFLITVVSRAIDTKGWRESIDVVTELREEYGRKVDLFLIGSGPEQERLAKEVLPNYVHLLGFQARPRDYYAISNLGMLLSTFSGESYPLTLIDCLATGTPVIATSLGDIPEMISGNGLQFGLLIQLQDGQVPLNKTASMIEYLIKNKEKYTIIANSININISMFNNDEMLNMYVKLYDECFNDK